MVDYTSIIAVYDEFQQAERAVEDLVNHGYRRENISLITNDSSGEYQRYVESLDTDVDDDDSMDADEGFGFGAVIGTLTGLGIALLPGVGPVFALGPLGAALISGIGAASGAATGGLVAGLTDIGADEDTAQLYSETVRRGGTLLVIRVAEENEDEVMSILNDYDPVDMEDRESSYRQENWLGFDEESDEPYTVEQVQSYREQYTTQQHDTHDTHDTDHDHVTNDVTRDEDVVTAEIVEENLKVGKRDVERGGIRVRKFLTSSEVSEDIDLRREEIHVDRQSVDRVASSADLDTFEEGTITMKETAEEVIVEKEARVVEEVEIYKDVDYYTETVEGTVRRTNIEVEGIDAEHDAFETHETVFRKYHDETYGDSEYTYNQYRPAYRYGYTLATYPEYRDAEWVEIESDARRRWEADNDSTWDDIKDAVHHSWLEVRQAVN